VGRVAELAWLEAAWTRAAHGRGGVVFLAGAQGMGKTRLAAELSREVHERGGWVLYGRCTPAAADPWQPFTQALAGWGAAGGAMPSGWQSPAAFGVDMAGLLTGRPDIAVLLILDNLHLAKAPMLEALAALVASAQARRLLVLGAYQDEAASPELAALVWRLDPNGVEPWRLGPFDKDEVAQVLGLYGTEQAARAATDAVLEASGGVPLLVHQAAGEWAQAQAANQVEQAARQTASSRGDLRRSQVRLADDVADLRELREHTQQVARLATGQPDEEPEDQPAAAVCPYKGLARFEPDDAGFFFGRERLVAELVTHLVGAGLVGVVGPSGSGKSSLVRAGLLPALADGALPGSDRWRQVLLRPGEHPMAELGLALGVGDSITAIATGGGGAALGDDGEARENRVSGRNAANVLLEDSTPAQWRRLLVVDQFEEVFTTCQDEAERAAFLAALVETAQGSDGQVTVVVAVRADYYGHCAADPTLASLLAANHVLVGPMDAGELRRAIELPARRAELRLEPGLLAAMVGEVADEPGGLPVLSCALLESWQHRRGRTLTMAAYQQAGGAHGAVGRLAERAWQQLDPEQQATARRILLRLAGPGEGEAIVRRRVPLDEFTASEDERAMEVLDALADQRLLTKSQDSVEVAHEALLREWPRLRGWLEEDVQGRVLHRHLIGAAREWEAAGRDPGELYRGARLTGALDWGRTHHGDLNQLEREFLDASQAAAEREVADARRRAEREARTSRRLRRLLVGLAGMLVLALVAGGLALTLRGRAEHQALVAKRQALVADARRLGAQALLEEDLDRSLLLARQAVALDDSVETRGDLLAALLRSPAAIAILRGNLDGIGTVGLSRDGRLLAVGDKNGNVAIYDLRTRRLLQEQPQGQEQVNDLEFSPDGSLLAISTNGEGDPVRLWDVHGARVRYALKRDDNVHVVTGVEFSPDGSSLVTLSVDLDAEPGKGNAFLTRWDVANGRWLKGPVHISSHGGDVLLASRDGARLVVVNGAEVLVEAARSFRHLDQFPHGLKQPQIFTAALSRADDRTLALGSTEGRIEFLDLSTGHRRFTNGRQEDIVQSIRFSQDGTTLATGGGDGTVKVWDVATGQLRETFHGHEARVAGLRFSNDGQTLYSAGSKSVIAWDLEGNRRLGRPFSFFPGASPAVAISPDGSLVATADTNDAEHVALRAIGAPQKVLRSLAPGIGEISGLAFSPDGTRLAVGSSDAPAPVLVDVASGKVLLRMTGDRHPGGIGTIRFDPTGRGRLVTGGLGGSREQEDIVWDTATGKPIMDLPMPGSGDVSVDWSRDGSTVATAGPKGKAILWRAADGTRLATLPVDKLYISSVAFSPDGSVLASTGLVNRAITLWDVATHKLMGRLPHPAIIDSVAFDPHGKTLATSSGSLRLWDLASMRQIGAALPEPELHPTKLVCDPCFSLTGFVPTGNQLIADYASGVGIVWDVDPKLWERRACAVVGRPLTEEEWKELLPTRSYQPACR
jgi:WD40 repeat protein